jgi:hypothetical protein
VSAFHPVTISLTLPALDPSDQARDGCLSVVRVDKVIEPSHGTEGSRRLGEAFRAAPLLRVLGSPGQRLVVVGLVQLAIADRRVVLEALVQGVWAEDQGWRPVPDAPGLEERLAPGLMSTAHRLPADDDQTVAAVIAKALAEASRDAVSALREIRYEIETAIAASLRRDVSDSTLPTLAALFELGVAGNRARDYARATARSGFWVWVTDDEAYQRYRRAQDPTIVNPHEPADASTRPWMRTHDAGVRQCTAMENQLTEEAAVIAGLLDAAATMAAAREAEAQETFNTLVAVAALGLGLPALVLTLYGTDTLVPMRTWQKALAMLPIALAAVVAGGVAAHRLPFGTARERLRLTALMVLALLVLLIIAGFMAPAATT